jgi:uncharacterized membrane protein YesL
MKRVIQVLWFTVRAVYDELFVLAGMGLIWCLAAIVIPIGLLFALTPIVSPIAGWIGLLLGLLILAPPVTAGLYNVAVEIAHERRIEFGYFWQGCKRYARRSWTIGAIVLASGGILAFNVSFYFAQESMVFTVIGFLLLWAFLLWGTAQIYLLPLVVHQEGARIGQILKNAALLVLAYPFFALGILIVALLTTALSGVLPFLLITIWMPFVAVLYSRAMVSSLQEVEAYRQRQVELEQEQEKEE